MSYKSYKPYKSYERLIVYWLATTIYDLTVIFTNRYIKSKKQKDQMDGAARSGKQNIVEGWLEKSYEGILKLLGIARASFSELKEDFVDYLRQNNLPLWDKNDPRTLAIRRTIDSPYKSYRSYKTYTTYIGEAEGFANLLITLCCKESYLLNQLYKSTEEKFVKEGGFREKLFKKRLAYRQKIAAAVITALLLNLTSPFWLFWQRPVLATQEIQIAEQTQALFEATDRQFRVEFGDKTDETKHRVRFEAVPEVSDNLPQEATPTAEVEKTLTERPFLEKAEEFVRDVFNREEKLGIEFSLVEASIEDESAIKTPRGWQAEAPVEAMTPPMVEEIGNAVTEGLSPLQQQVINSLNTQLEEIATESAEIEERLDKIKGEVAGIVSEARQVYAKTELIEESGEWRVENREVVEGVDVEYEILPGKGVKEEIIIKPDESYGKDCLNELESGEWRVESGNLLPTPYSLLPNCSLPKNTYTFTLKLDPGVQIHQSLTGTKDRRPAYTISPTPMAAIWGISCPPSPWMPKTSALTV